MPELEADFIIEPPEGFDCSFEINANSTTWGNIEGDIENQTDLKNALDSKADDTEITEIDGRLDTIEGTISGYGNIVTHDTDEFATAAQGALADSAVQPSELNNYVPNTRTVNGKALSSNITLNYSDVGALADTTTISDLATETQMAAINSGANTTNIGQITTNTNDIITINGKIPEQASTTNQLADKNFVNSSVATNTANFIGTFNSVADLEAYSGTVTNNDYAFVISTDADGNTVYNRYKYNGETEEWLFEYALNNSSFTSTQWAAINSGITSSDVTTIGTALQPNDNISELNNDAGYITSSDLSVYLENTATGTNSLTILGDATTASTALNIGEYSTAEGANSVAIGSGSGSSHRTRATNSGAIAIGYDALALAQDTIQLGTGSVSVNGRFQVWSYPMLEKSTGLIPDGRISTNIARTTDIPAPQVQADWDEADPTSKAYIQNKPYIPSGVIVDQTYDSTSTNAQSGTAVAEALSTVPIPTNYVTTDTDQNITGTKTYVGQKKIAFKQSGTSDKLGFTLYNNSNTEKGYLEYNPSNTVDSVPLMTLGNYASASGGLTHVGFRKYSSISGASGAYNLLAPLISDAKTPFSLTTTYTNFYLPLGFTDGNTTVLTNKSGMVDLSSIIPTMPTVNNATLTIQKNGTNVQTFTANASSDVTANITVPTDVSDLTNTTLANKSLSNLNTDGENRLHALKGYTESGQVYSDTQLYNDIYAQYSTATTTGTDTIISNNYTVVGSPTITDGVASGFDLNGGNYVTTSPFVNNLADYDTWSIEIPITLRSDTVNNRYDFFLSNFTSDTTEKFTCQIKSGGNLRFTLKAEDNSNIMLSYSTTTAYSAGDSLVVKIEFTGTQYIISVKKNNVWSTEITVNNSKKLYKTSQPFNFGVNLANNNFNWVGSINLYGVRVIGNNKLIYACKDTITYNLTSDGNKIADVQYRPDVYFANYLGYKSSYFTIDTVNQNVTLPYKDIYGLINQSLDYNYTRIQGYNASATQTLKHVSGVLQWVTD